MTEYLTEQEQVEQLKNWIKQYGLTVLAGIVLSMVIVTGWHYWQSYQNKILSHASAIYDEMLMLRAQNNNKGVATEANKLLDHYAKTPYAQLAALMLARNAVLNKNYDEAATQLNWVIDHGNNAAIREIARTRLARILIAEKKPDEAFTLLDKIEDKTFMGLVSELKGDAYLQQHNTLKAKDAYQFALQSLPKDEASLRPILQMKLDNLATNSDPIA